jgi:hypothetical protein
MRRDFVYPNPEDCTASFAEVVHDVYYLRELTEAQTKRLRTCYGTMDWFLLAVNEVFEANGWTFDRRQKAPFRKIYRGEPYSPNKPTRPLKKKKK